MAWWQITLIILTAIITGSIVGSLISKVILRLLQKRTTASKSESIKQFTNLLSPGKGIWDKVLVATLLIIILVTLGALSYVITTPKTGEKFTEFYILGLSGKAANYPKELKSGEEGWVIVGIINHEEEEISYRVQVFINGNDNADELTVILSNEQKWEGAVRFVPEIVGENQRVEFLLYRGSESGPYLEPLYLWIDVIEQ